MIIKFWGVRGSYPTVRAGVMRYGGNTSCVSVQIGKKLLVIDAGSGVRILGNSLGSDITDIYFLLTHLHRDHIDGFPFFAPLYREGCRIHLIDYRRGGRSWSLVSMFDGVHYPMKTTSIRSVHNRVKKGPMKYLRSEGFDISRLRLNHPGGAFGYKVIHNGKAFVHMPDNELDPPSPKTPLEEMVAFCEGAYLLSHDAMYVSAEMPQKRGWGHSSVRQTCQLASAARVDHLVLFHHAPERDDAHIDIIQDEARKTLAVDNVQCTAAFEGLTVNLG